MVFQTLSSFAWFAVIAIQAFIHFVVGPRYSSLEKPEKNHSNSCTGTSTEEEATKAREEANMSSPTLDTVQQNCEHEDDDGEISFDETDHSWSMSNKTPTTAAMDKTQSIEPDERDSVDEGIRGIQNAKQTDVADSPNHSDRSAHFSGSGMQGGNQAAGETHEDTKSRSDPKCPSQRDDDYIEDDEEWRFQLIKDYYATSYYRMMSESTSNIHGLDKGEDPPLFPVGTINTLSERIDEQNKLAKINLNSQQNSRTVSFDHSPVSVIASC